MSIPKDAFKIFTSKKWKKGMDEIFKKTIKLLNDNNYEWSIGSGTLLGKVRHNDYIPWDDDIDLFVSIREDEINEFRKLLDKTKIPYRKISVGFQLFGPYLKSPVLDIMVVDKNWKYHNRTTKKWSKDWTDPNFKGKLITTKLRGMTIKMPNKKESDKYLSSAYGKDYMTHLLITNHK